MGKDSKWTAKTTSTACKRLKDTAIMCNAPGSKADDKYAVQNKGCGKCVAADKTAGKCGECNTADCNTKVVDSSALSITALLLPLRATLYTFCLCYPELCSNLLLKLTLVFTATHGTTS